MYSTSTTVGSQKWESTLLSPKTHFMPGIQGAMETRWPPIEQDARATPPQCASLCVSTLAGAQTSPLVGITSSPAVTQRTAIPSLQLYGRPVAVTWTTQNRRPQLVPFLQWTGKLPSLSPSRPSVFACSNLLPPSNTWTHFQPFSQSHNLMVMSSEAVRTKGCVG